MLNNGSEIIPSLYKIIMRLKVAMTILLCLIPALTTAIEIVCQNGGTPAPGHCRCPPNFAGTTCEYPAGQLSPELQHTTISKQYKYFYFQPEQVNFYKLNFTICMQSNPSNSPIQFFVSTQKIDGSLKAMPAFYEKFKLLLNSHGCTSFPSHYISVKRRDDDSFRRVIVGMRSLEKNHSNFYFNVFKSQNLNQTEFNSTGDLQQKEMVVNIKMVFEVYLQTTYSGSFIILTTALVLMVIFIGIIVYIRQKFNQEREEEQSWTMRSMSSDTRRYNPQFQFYHYKNDLTFLDAFMPVTMFSQGSKYYMEDIMRCNWQGPQNYSCDQSCSICLVEFQSLDQIRTTPCRHRYHQECIDNWCETSLSCPICRRPLDFTKQIRTLYIKYLRRGRSR